MTLLEAQREDQMKLSSIVCASIVTLAAIAAVGVAPTLAASNPVGNVAPQHQGDARVSSELDNVAGEQTAPNTGHNTTKPCLNPNGKPIPGRFQPNCAAFQSTDMNSSRSNIKNN